VNPGNCPWEENEENKIMTFVETTRLRELWRKMRESRKRTAKLSNED
jgi:CBS domain containing-hemolysin-like protein